ncbi:MAG: hydroxymethylbilane synthase [Desulfofustis sp.]|jgi:hydroxymethylbilane synthase|nr:hydroxymethylbilane synthase [Desulfofustis sp.]
MTTITVGTRKSRLAMWQTETVCRMLQENGCETRIVAMETRGDKILDRSIAKIGSKGVFTEELEEQLAAGVVDIAVHSAKDMQSTLPEGFELIAFTEREQSHDVLVGARPVNLDDTSRPLTIGTSSVRRVALLAHFHPHVRTVPMRGNLQTRLKKLEDGACDALILAYAGVYRMGYDDLIVHSFAAERFIPPVGQGCIAVEASSGLAAEKKELVRTHVNKRESELCLRAERAFLKTMEGGCSIPAFGHAVIDRGQIRLTAGLASLSGSRLLKTSVSGPLEDPEALGTRAGASILADGGRELLAAIRSQLET